jgi:putative ABC transport system permease protein
MDADSERGFATLMSQRYSSVTLIRVKEAIELVSSLLGQFNRAIWVLSLVTIGASLLVLAGALASGRRARLYDATILKTLGADRRRILTIFLAEYAFIGGFSSLLAGVIGCLASWALIAGAMQSDWQFLPDVFVLSVVASLGLTLLLAATGLWYQLAASSRETLRNN